MIWDCNLIRWTECSHIFWLKGANRIDEQKNAWRRTDNRGDTDKDRRAVDYVNVFFFFGIFSRKNLKHFVISIVYTQGLKVLAIQMMIFAYTLPHFNGSQFYSSISHNFWIFIYIIFWCSFTFIMRGALYCCYFK